MTNRDFQNYIDKVFYRHSQENFFFAYHWQADIDRMIYNCRGTTVNFFNMLLTIAHNELSQQGISELIVELKKMLAPIKKRNKKKHKIKPNRKRDKTA